MELVEEYFAKARAVGAYPERYDILAKEGIAYHIKRESDGKEFHVKNFSSNDVLGFAQSDMVKQAAIEATHAFGTSNSSCTLYCGRLGLHSELEAAISRFKKSLTHTYFLMLGWPCRHLQIRSAISV